MPIDPSPDSSHQTSSPTIAQLLSVAACCFCAGGLYGWSALIPAIEDTFTQSTELAGLIFSIAIVAFTLAVLIAPRLPRTMQDINGCFVFGIVGAIAISIASLSTTYTTFVLTFSIGFGVCSGAIYINSLSVAAKAKRPAVVTPLMVASFGFGGASFGPAWSVLVDRGWSLQSLWPLVVALFFIALLTRLTIRAKSVVFVNEQSEALPYPVDNTNAKATNQMILLWLTFAFGSTGGLMVLGLASKFIEHAGGSVFLVSIGLIGVAIGNTAGRLSVSLYSLVITPARVSVIASLIIGGGLLITRLSEGAIGISAGLTIVAMGYGTMASAIPTLTRTLFPAEQFARRFSLVFTAWGAAGLTAPWIAGSIYDSSGSFDGALLAAIVATLAGIVTASMMRKSL